VRTSLTLALGLLALAAACSDKPDTTAPSITSDSEAQADDRLSSGQARSGTVYVVSNDASANAVLVFQRGRDGRLGTPTAVVTGGRGTGSDLGNQGAIALERGRLYAINAGSDQISAFAVEDGSLQLLQTIPSGGNQPISLALHDDLLYVLNDGATANITGFRVQRDGRLSPIPGSTRPRSAPPGTVDGAQISFSPGGRSLVVTEKAANLIVTYPVLRSGLTDSPIVHQSSGPTPFGFGFARHRTLIVSEAAGGAPNASSVSSYTLDRQSRLDPVSRSVPTGQTAACWIAVTANGRLAYTTNTGSGTVSGFEVAGSGALTSLGVSGTTGAGSGPIDLAFSPGDEFLYVLNGGNRTISIFRVEKDGGLTLIENVGGLPSGATGLAVR
jgi:6-phosphogluconolactonase (cycloisomerase 2 family)